MTTMIRDFVNSLSDDEKIEIFNDYEKFEEDGFIGDCALRRAAETFDTPHVVMWMAVIANEVRRYFTMKYLHEQSKLELKDD